MAVSRGGGVCSGRGVSALGGCLLQGGVSHHALKQTPPPACGQTDACKNITFATSLRTEKMGGLTKEFLRQRNTCLRSECLSHLGLLTTGGADVGRKSPNTAASAVLSWGQGRYIQYSQNDEIYYLTHSKPSTCCPLC